MSLYQKDIATIVRDLLFQYEIKRVYNKSYDLGIIGVVEVKLLEYIRDNQRVHANTLMKEFNIKLTKLTKIIKKLCDNKYLIKIEDVNDKRYNILSLTEKSEKLLADYNQTEEELLKKILTGITVNEEKTLMKFLEKIKDNNI